MDRRSFLVSTLGLGALTACRASGRSERKMSDKLPVIFVGHGSPTNVLEDNAFTRGYRALGQSLGKPKAILAISAHWWTPGLQLTGDLKPKTIHDFGGFPQEMYELQYPAPGAPDLAGQVRDKLGDAKLSSDWGLDHGTWTVLKHMYPDADVPVVQLSLDKGRTAAQHLELGRALADLRSEGVLIVGSGNVTHNLREAFGQMRTGDKTSVPEWSRAFDELTVKLTEARDEKITTLHATDLGRVAHPTVEHWLPYLVTFGAAARDDAVSYPVEGFDIGLSMRATRWG
jgi:4,5-DOPA dioxygenase extradiol